MTCKLQSCHTGPGGEDLEGGYYDAGDNLKVCLKAMFKDIDWIISWVTSDIEHN